MRAVILQPHFLPFVGYFDLLARADVFVFYDTVQFRRRSWHCRTWVRDGGVARWLGAPVRTPGGSRVPMADVAWDDAQGWRPRVAKRLAHLYAGERRGAMLERLVEHVLRGPSALADWNIIAILEIAAELGIVTPTLRSSALPPMTGDKQDRLIRICRLLGATTYLCGPGSRPYVSERRFAEAGIAVEWIGYDYPGAVPNPFGEPVLVSAADLLLRDGASAVSALLAAERAVEARR